MICICSAGAPLAIFCKGDGLYPSEGDNVTLACTVRGVGFDAFSNPIIWYKRQRDGSLVQINTGAVINAPFADTARFDITPVIDRDKDEPEVYFPLRLTGETFAIRGINGKVQPR